MAEAAEKRPGVLASAGTPIKGEFPGLKQMAEEPAPNTEKPNTTLPDTSADDKTKDKDKTTEGGHGINDPALTAYFKEHGIEYTGIEDFKKQLTAKKEPAAELTDEQKQEIAAKKEQRLLQLHLQRKGGTIENFTNLKRQAETAPEELGKLKLKMDLKEAGFDEATAENIAKKMHLDVSDEELDGMDAAEQDQIKKERSFGAKKLANRGFYIQKEAKDYFSELEREATDQDNDTNLKKTYSAKVDEAIEKYQRKQTIELGKLVETEDAVPAYDVEIPEEVFTAAKDLLKDLDKSKKSLIAKDGSLNLDFLLPHLINSLSAKNTAQKSYRVATDAAIKKLKGNFSEKQPDLGASKEKKDGVPGKLVSAGQPVRGTPGK